VTTLTACNSLASEQILHQLQLHRGKLITRKLKSNLLICSDFARVAQMSTLQQEGDATINTKRKQVSWMESK
jgi:hypothetical protein